MRCLRLSILAPVLGTGLLAGAVLPTVTAAQPAQPIVIPLAPQGGSGASGTATLTPSAGQTLVVIELQDGAGPHPTHIHEGTCENLNPTPKFPLSSVRDGRSETTVNVMLMQLLATPHAINVHKSPEEAIVYVSCGEITGRPGPGPAAKPGVPAGVEKPGGPGPGPMAKPGGPGPGPMAKPGGPGPVGKPGGPGPGPAAKPGAPVQVPAALPRTGEAESWAVGGLILAGLLLIGVGLVARRRGI